MSKHGFLGLAMVALAAGALAREGWGRGGPRQLPSPGHAYVAGDEGLAVVDAADPGNLRFLSQGAASAPVLDVASHDLVPGVAYVALGNSWAVLDLDDPRAPVLGKRQQTAGQATKVAVVDGWLYVVVDDAASATASILVLDATNPLDPTAFGQVAVGAPVSGIDGAGGFLYVATGSLLLAYDMGDPQAPRLTGRVPRKAVDVAVDGSVAYVLEDSALAVADLGNPGQPQVTGVADLPVGGAVVVAGLGDDECVAACGRAVVGAVAAPTGGGGGLMVVDATTPSRPLVAGRYAAGSSFVGLAGTGPWLHVAAVTEYALFRAVAGGSLEMLGALDTSARAVAMGAVAEQATPTPTRSSDTPTPTATSVPPTATLTPSGTATTSPTATRPQPTPSRTPTRFAPSPTAGPPPVWERHDRTSGPVPFDAVRYVRQAPDRTVWLRVRRGQGGPDRVLESTGSRVRIHAGLAAAVEARYSTIVEGGTVPDLWTVDDAQRVWVGPEYYDGAFWRRLAVDERQPGGSLIHDQRTLVDAEGMAWVPYRATVSCPDPRGCRRVGLRVFGPDALEREVPVEVVPDAEAFGVDAVVLVPGSRGAPPDQAGMALAAHVDVSSGPHQVPGTDFVVTQRRLMLLPQGQEVTYPLLEASGGATQNAGYATSATLRPDGLLQVFTWIEDHASRPALTWRILANTWNGAGWETWDITAECPLVHDGNDEFLRITAAAYSPDGTLWLGSSLGELALWSGGVWVEHFTPQNSPLLDGRPVTDIMITDAGGAWIVQPGALLTYGPPGLLTPVITAFLPAAHQR